MCLLQWFPAIYHPLDLADNHNLQLVHHTLMSLMTLWPQLWTAAVTFNFESKILDSWMLDITYEEFSQIDTFVWLAN